MSAIGRALLAVAIVLGYAGGSGAQVRPDEPPPEGDPRSIERLSYRCHNELGRRDITLFANGTVRVRDGLYDEERMDLGEMTPEHLAQTVATLARQDPSDGIGSVAESGRVGGPFVEDCVVRLELAGREPVVYAFSRHDALPLRVRRLIDVAEQLATVARPPRAGLPVGYEPDFGDVLVDALDHRYRVQFRTVDGTGVELVGIDQPVRLIIAIDALAERFVAVEPARPER